MKKLDLTSQRGASVIEILIVVALIGILTALAVARFGSARENFDRRNVAREFKVSLERAKFDSVKRRASTCTDMSGVTVNTTNFTLMTDMNQNGTLDASERRQIDLNGRSNVTIVPNGVNLPFTIRFDERGRAYLNDCDPDSTPTANVPLLFFCNGVCTTATANDQNSSVIFVSPAGTVAMLNGGSGMPTFGAPTVSTQPVGDGINHDLLVTTDTGTAPTPGPSTSPVASPSTTPATSPSVTPNPTTSPSTTPTATPTPAPACATHAPWGSPPACTCVLPQTTRSNGQCK